MILGGNDDFEALPTAPGQPPPEGFPTTRNTLAALTSQAAANFLQQYNLHVPALRDQRISSLARHAGLVVELQQHH